MKRPQSLDNSFNDVKYEQYINNLNARLPSLNDPNDIDKRRWPWELVQNAKDTVVRRPVEKRFVDISFRYFIGKDGKKKLSFQHNGEQFTDKAITGLIWKFSAEKRNEFTEDGLSREKQSTGRFGTGFMTTHALSKTVDISGSMYNGDEGVCRNVSVDFTLHREGPSDQDYREGVDRTEREMAFDDKPIPPGEILPTSFVYHLRNEVNEQAAETGLENVRFNAAQTMLFCPTIRSISIDDEINNYQFKIFRDTSENTKDELKESLFIEESSETTTPIIRRFISIEVDEVSDVLSSYWKVEDRHLRLHVAVEVDDANNILPIPTTSPSCYCALPLIGFEKMSLPYYVNSNDFEPNEPRTALFLNKRRSKKDYNIDTNQEFDVVIQNGVNWSILERSLSLYEKIVDFLIEHDYNKRYNLINGLSNILKGSWGKETENCLASRFILPLRNMLVYKNLVKTAEGYKSIKSEVKFVECAKECDIHALYNICETIYGINLAVEEENEKWVSLKWGRFTFDTDFDEKKADSENPAFPTIKYDNVAKYIEDASCIDNLNLIIENDSDTDSISDTEQQKTFVVSQKLLWLNKFYEWIEISKITNLTDKKIVPNRLGDFCSTEQGCDLKDASDIPTSIFDFMKRISIDWDENLLMEGVQHITLTKETKDNVVTAIKDRSKEIRDDKYSNDGFKLTKLLPLLMSLPSTGDGRTQDFYNKRSKILSILRTIYQSDTEKVDSSILELKAETWEDSDKWFMSLVSKEIANREHLDVIGAEDTEEQIASKYCTSEWLSDIVNFMFDKGYLHLDDITESESSDNVLSIIPNRYGNFKPINLLYKQGLIPDKLLDDSLKDTGFDIKEVLLYDGFVLNEKAKITDYQITTLASKYNEYFDSEDDDKKESVANFLLHLVPEYGEQHEEIRNLYDKFNNVEDTAITSIKTSELSIWKGAMDYMIGLLAENASECKNIFTIGKKLKNFTNEEELTNEQKNECSKLGMSWLNRLAQVIKNSKVSVKGDLLLIPDWYGNLHPSNKMIYDGTILNRHEHSDSLVELVDSELWSHFPDEEKEKGDDNMTSSIVHPQYVFAEEFQNNTDEKLFNLVDRLVFFCSEHNSTEWRILLKHSIQTLLFFFESNESKSMAIFSLRNMDDTKLSRLFPETYKNRKNLSYDYIYDAETKARFSQINDSYSSDEIEILIENKDFVRKMLQSNDLITIQKIIEEFPDTDFKSILTILRKEQGEFNLERFQQNISDVRKREIGDKGECFVYEMLCSRFGSVNVTWSNYTPNDANARIVSFNGRDYRLSTTSHDFDFVVSHKGKTIYIEVKTTVGNIKSSKDFPLIFESKEWEWIDQNNTDEATHYIVRVFDIEHSPKAYFLRQLLSVEP